MHKIIVADPEDLSYHYYNEEEAAEEEFVPGFNLANGCFWFDGYHIYEDEVDYEDICGVFNGDNFYEDLEEFNDCEDKEFETWQQVIDYYLELENYYLISVHQ